MALVAAISFSSCKSENGTEGIDEKRITINDVQIATEEGKILNGTEGLEHGEWPHVGSSVLYKGKPFSGKVWSKDGKTAATEVYSGFPVSFIGYYDNGNVAVVMTGKNGDVVLYDENGSYKEHISNGESWDNPLCEKYMELLEKENLIQTFWDM